MKYILYIPYFTFIGICILIGGICFMWRFSRKDFENGVVYLDRKVKFTKFMSKTFKIAH